MAALCQYNDAGICIQCGRAEKPGVRMTCPKRHKSSHVKPIPEIRPAKVEPSLLAKGTMYCAAVSRWKLAGSPVRTQEQVNECLAICGTCEFFTGTNCAKCGCPINNIVDTPRKNKIALATEHCPVNKW